MALDGGLLDEPSDKFKAANPDWDKRVPGPVLWFGDVPAHLGVPEIMEDTLAMGAMSVIYGESNSGKTFFACTAAIHAALGREFFGLKMEKTGVVYVALEGTHGIMNRISAFKKEYGMRDIKDVPFGLVTVPFDLCTSEEDTERLISLIKDAGDEISMPIGWIILDTLARAMGSGNENASEDMGALVRNGDRIRSETGAHVTFIHHSGKDQARGARGHSSLRAATDTEIEVSTADKIHTARVTKQRDFDCVGDFGFKLRVVEIGRNQRGKAVSSCVLVPHDLDSTEYQRPVLKGANKQAYEILGKVLAEGGQRGRRGVPSDYLSVHEAVWRQRFYDSGMPGAEYEAKKKAFQRASNNLKNDRFIGSEYGHVWDCLAVILRDITGDN